MTASEWVYDYASRKPISREFTFSNGAWTQTDEKRRVFDGMDVVQERNGLNEVTAQLVRSGNIGGILSRSTNDGASFFGYDGGGNVTLLTNENGQEVGHYRYDAFGNTLEASGARAVENPYRFSTKELCSSGLYDYGFRFYSPSSGNWFNRDPSEENGGVNLYGMVDNDPVNLFDDYGLAPQPKVKVVFDRSGDSRNTKDVKGKDGTLTFYVDGKQVKQFPAHNRTEIPTDNPKTVGSGPAPNGTYTLGPPRPRPDDKFDGKFGGWYTPINNPYGRSIGIHSRKKEGSRSWRSLTQGCIRTTIEGSEYTEKFYKEHKSVTITMVIQN